MKTTSSNQPRQGTQKSGQCFISRWKGAFSKARKNVQKQQWHKAALAYTHAYEIVDHLLTIDGSEPETIRRYVRTAIELAYSMRMSHHECDMEALVAIVKFRLQGIRLDTPVEPLIIPLKDISMSSKAEVSRWMKVLFALDEARRQPLH